MFSVRCFRYDFVSVLGSLVIRHPSPPSEKAGREGKAEKARNTGLFLVRKSARNAEKWEEPREYGHSLMENRGVARFIFCSSV